VSLDLRQADLRRVVGSLVTEMSRLQGELAGHPHQRRFSRRVRVIGIAAPVEAAYPAASA
jgi:hypothetical protein